MFRIFFARAVLVRLLVVSNDMFHRVAVPIVFKVQVLGDLVQASLLSLRDLRFILIGECCFHDFKSLEIIGDRYQYTEAFCHYS